MGEKSIQKKQYIVDKSKEVFAARGFREVTMKELVEACEISRGGLYLYFADTASVFEAAIAEDSKMVNEALKETDGTPAQILLEYLDALKTLALKKKDNLCVAKLEYAFFKKDASTKRKMNDEIKAIEKLIADGKKKKEMTCDDVTAAAKNVMCQVYGLMAMAGTVGVSAAEVDKEINAIMGSLGLVVK